MTGFSGLRKKTCARGLASAWFNVYLSGMKNTETTMKRLFGSALVCAFVLAGGMAHAFFGLFESDTVTAENGVVSIPVSDVSDGKAHHFSFEANDKTVKFFVIKSPDGVLRAAFDACDVCWREGKGYSQQGAMMICNNCGQQFHSTRINEVKGGCNPAPLKRTQKNGELLIQESDLFAGMRYFL